MKHTLRFTESIFRLPGKVVANLLSAATIGR